GFIDDGAEIAALPRNEMFVRMFEAGLRNVIYTINTETGRFEEVYEEDSWLGHFQFSPTDPDTLMFCHEGPWEWLDRIWLLSVSTGKTRLVYKRKHPGEIAGHEFWAPDGKSVWFDLRNRQTGTFALAKTDLDTGETSVYPLKPEEWSVHYNIGRHASFLCGDGGGVGPWIYRFDPQPDLTMDVTKLCSIRENDYATCEPNVHVTPDGEWALFTSNQAGENRLYAVSTTAEDNPG
ncbi:MAG TPA: oligogalacturonate lyase family protein, partial [Armatimonadota bacterium]|nr:oligogalacturonate lyase family protein [Armatimonadota bacterium]